MKNERITEDIVREHFKKDPLFSTMKWEEQKSKSSRINQFLKESSKSGKKRQGYPEFIITAPSVNSEYIIIIECKSDPAKHESEGCDQPKEYAVDGVLHYAEHISKGFHVLAIAASGQTEEEMAVSSFLWRKNENKYEKLPDKKLLSLHDYFQKFKNDTLILNLKNINITEKAIELNEDFHSCGVSEETRNTLVSAILLALQNQTFRTSYKESGTPRDLGDDLLTAVKRVLGKHKVRKIDEMMGVYRGILNEPIITSDFLNYKKEKISTIEFFKDKITYIEEKVWPLTRMEESGYDILGKFYTEFIRYAASQQKQGLVLTPAHVADLFCDLAELTENSIVYDPSCGTGGFLIAAMKRMLELAGNDSVKKASIRKNQLLGVEKRPKMFTIACSNMMLRGDGKSNLDCGDCFDEQITENIRKKTPNIAFLNPPYNDGTADQLRFVEKALNTVAPQNGRVVAIVQMSCALTSDNETLKVKRRLLEHHRLHAVLSMPDDLFYPVGVVTCIMFFDAGKPNSISPTWFGYFKDDGFEKRKNKGRIDARGRWKAIRKKWLDAFLGEKEVPGFSVRKNVSADDEWCAEAYMETDYSNLNQEDFEKKVREFIAFKFLENRNNDAA